MKKFHVYLLLILGLTLASCGSTATLVNKKAIEVDWIVGKWKQKDGELYEKWIKVSQTEYKGLAYDLSKGYAVITENMRIFSTGKDAWFFEAILVENKNNAVLFKWVPDPIVALKFVNEQHDFPQIVQYKREAFDIMSASISNLAGDKKLVFDYTRYVTQ
ncbi:MAG: hypothetical protein IPL31_03640 [Saprospiraceae bacterium]|nr:hypothetical protein [Saprospiraceae bacterium]